MNTMFKDGVRHAYNGFRRLHDMEDSRWMVVAALRRYADRIEDRSLVPGLSSVESRQDDDSVIE